MKTAVGLSLLVVGLVVGIAASAVLSIGTVVRPSVSTSISVSTIFSTAVLTYTATVQTTLVVSSTVLQVQSSSASAPPQSGESTTSVMQTTETSSSSAASSMSNVTIAGLVTVPNDGTVTELLLTSQSGLTITIHVQGVGDEISASVPNNETYNVVVYYFVTGGGSSTCDATQPLYVYSQVPVLAVSISC
jgi:hypothetical protein